MPAFNASPAARDFGAWLVQALAALAGRGI
jgi:hypothetical protein